MFDECPTPWTSDGWGVFDRDGNDIAETLADGTAELIVKVANTHEALVAALRALCDAYDSEGWGATKHGTTEGLDAYRQARAALALVDGALDAPASS